MTAQPTRATAYPGSEAQIYDEVRFTDAGGKRIHEREFSRVADTLKHLDKGADVVEVGCGTGRIIDALTDRQYTITGVDASPEMVEQAKAKFPDPSSTKFVVASAHDTTLPADSFDAAYSIRLLNQTESPAYALTVVTEMARIVKPGGTVMVEYIPEKRPALFGATRASVRLNASDVLEAAEAAGLTNCEFRGAFFLGMQSYKRLPPATFGLLDLVDKYTDRWLPTWCARVYLVATKSSAN